tara:strand:- start:24 stop:989 length:966 start_codon:yes stop_codon:yes gene_type:complete
MKPLAYLGVVVGLSLIAWLIIWHDAGSISMALFEINFGILYLLPIYAIYLSMGVFSWRLLFAPGREPSFGWSLNAIWIGSAVNTLLPVASLGGEAVKARLLTLRGVDALEAGGSVLGDTTVQALSLALWGLIGAAMLAALSFESDMLWAAFLAAGLFCAGVFVFVLLQRNGIFAFLGKRIVGQRFGDLLLNFDQHVREIYDRPVRVIASTLVRLASRIFLTMEIWIAAWLIGQPISLVEAIMIRSLTGAVRGAAFFIPNGLGIQEGAFMVFGSLIGIPPGYSLSLSLIVRVREIAASVPALFVWQAIEGRSLVKVLKEKSS